MNGDLARFTRLLCVGTHPVGYKASEPVLSPAPPLSSWCSHWTGGESGVSILTVSILSGRRQDREGMTALHVAANQGRLEVARLLLASGADVNAKVSIASGYRLLQPPPRVGLRSNRTG